MRYATMLGLDTSARVQPTHPDAGSTSQFAADAMQWAVAEGLILGNSSGMLNPRLDRDACGVRRHPGALHQHAARLKSAQSAPEARVHANGGRSPIG